jgi:long-chain-acyl-CoA dehydrogenase
MVTHLLLLFLRCFLFGVITGQISRECWKEAGKQGLLCVTMPEEFGGAGADILASAVVWEEQSYTNCTGPGFSLHSEIVAPYILNYGTDAQKKKYLPGMALGELIGAIAMTEPGAGSDLQGMRTTALQKQPGGDFILNGSKTYITNGIV